jgi:hypothetical protein
MNSPVTRILFCSVLILACGGPRDYNDCILRSVKPGMTERAVALVTNACAQKFPTSSDQTAKGLAQLPSEARERLTGRLGQSELTGEWRGNLYNGNTDWTVEEITLLIESTTHPDSTDKAPWATPTPPLQTEPERYRVSLHVPPLTNTTFTVSMNWLGDLDWSVESARGTRNRS